MRAFAFVLLAVAGVHCDADAYTLGQVAHGYGFGGIGNRGYIGKREADADAYTIGQVAYGLPIHNAYATGHPHNVGVVTGYGYGHYGFGKREADSEADAYTIGQVAYGLPIHNAYATGHPHNVGVVTGYSGYGLGYA